MAKSTTTLPENFTQTCTDATRLYLRAKLHLEAGGLQQAEAMTKAALSTWAQASLMIRGDKFSGKAAGIIADGTDKTTQLQYTIAQIIERRDYGPRPGFFGRLIDFCTRP
jgi:hypothetical protein